MSGHCILVGFQRGGGLPPIEDYEEWADQTLVKVDDAPMGEDWITWTREHFVSASEYIPDPETEAPKEWAIKYFVGA